MLTPVELQVLGRVPIATFAASKYQRIYNPAELSEENAEAVSPAIVAEILVHVFAEETVNEKPTALAPELLYIHTLY